MLANTSSIKWELAQWRQQMWRRGEDVAVSYLERLGWHILERNWYAKNLGELDIIARDPTGLLVFVEVKARIDPQEAGISQVGFESVGRSKQQKLIRSARFYMSEHQPYTSGYRFDVIVVTFDEVDGSEPAERARQSCSPLSKEEQSSPLASRRLGSSDAIGLEREGTLSFVPTLPSSPKARQRAHHRDEVSANSSIRFGAPADFSNTPVAPQLPHRQLRNASFLDSKLIVHVKQAFP